MSCVTLGAQQEEQGGRWVANGYYGQLEWGHKIMMFAIRYDRVGT